LNPEGNLIIRDNLEVHRFEAQVGDSLAIAEYRLRDGVITFTHTEVPEGLRGHGVASRLIKNALDESRAQQYQVIPLCPFVAAYIRRHPEYQDLVVPRFNHLIS